MERLIRKIAERLEVGITPVAQALAAITRQLEQYRQQQLEARQTRPETKKPLSETDTQAAVAFLEQPELAQVKDGKIQIKAHAEKGDVLKIMGKDGNASYYTYDPDNKDANQQGYVGSGTEDTEQAVTVTAKKEEKSGNAPPWLLIAAGEAAHGVRRNADGTNNPRILEYLHTVDPRVNSENTPWCAGCVNWSLQQAGIQGDNSLHAMLVAGQRTCPVCVQ
ncbi:MAG TPA: hypothetical protein VHE54_06995 [Puia sp.]|nr:hypothetical protein [Puia sp.]